MADITTYDVFDDGQLAEEIIRLNAARKALLTQAGAGDRNYSKDFNRIDRDFANAVKAWAKRGGSGLPTSVEDRPSAEKRVPTYGTTDYSELRIS